MKNILEVKNICKTYQAKNGEIEALKDINFKIEEGEYVSIIGPSGCGKSTLLSIIAGLENKTSGTTYINGKIGYMLQKDNLLEWRTVLNNVFLGLEIQRSNTPENKKYAIELLKKYGLYEFKDKYPNQLSGGMRQRVALIRTLAIKPKILLLDEAFSKMDQERSAVCLKYARKMDLQLIVCVPDERLQSLIRNVDCVYGFRRHQNQVSMMHIDKGDYLDMVEGNE